MTQTWLIVFLVAVLIIVALGLTLVIRTFHGTKRRQGSENDEEYLRREVARDSDRGDGHSG